MQRRVFLQFLTIVGLAGACARRKAPAPLSSGATVIAFGDSVTYGLGADRGQDWPSLLAGQTGWNVINAGVSGDTTETALPRIPSLMEMYKPELVILELGGNDFLNRRPPKTVKENLRAIVKRFRRYDANVPIAIVAIPELSLIGALTMNLSDSPIYAELAKEENLWLIDKVFSEVLSNATLRADQIHPNAKGYRQMAIQIGETFRKSGFLR
ncbi:MAG: GDSL-type esterase/lipase family protein [Candidatus Accumulibacter sp.]|nr:GDSL-type esterase/lipase family protein [Accumulibacter sp.]